MPVTLRDYQIDLLDRLRGSVRRHKRPICQSPTGSGKTALITHMIGETANRLRSAVFVVHRGELLEQTSRALSEQGVSHGIIAGNHPMRPRERIQVATIQTLSRREVSEPDLLVIDEAHRSCGQSYRALLKRWPNSYVVGLTATPARTDGQGLDDLYSDMVCGPEVRELIDDGWLADYELYAPPSMVSTQGLHVRKGDYVRSEAEEATDQAKVTGDAVRHYQRSGCRRGLVFCTSRRHAAHVAARYRDAGIQAQAVTGETPPNDRRQALKGFANGAGPDVIVSVELFIEGLDISGVELVQMLRPTQSLIVYCQAIGRALRPKADGVKAVVLDHVGNAIQHGLPDDPREWRLEGLKSGSKGEKEEGPQPRICDNCFAMFAASRTRCPACGSAVSVDESNTEPPKEDDGELQEVDRDQWRRDRKREEARAKGLEDLVSLALSRGYKPGWAAHRYHARHGGDFQQLKKQAHQLAKRIA